MIALETVERMNRSPKKPKVEIQFANDRAESSDDGDVDSGQETEENMVESADEGDIEDALGSDEVESGSAEEEDDSTAPNSNSDDDKSKGNPGWADAMKKILRTKKPKRKTSIVLSKAKKLCDVVPKSKIVSPGFEVDGNEEIVTEEPSKKLKTSQDKREKEAEHGMRKRREVDLGIRVKPTPLDRDREKTLQKIATKGVVQLFNAVRQQQKDIEKRLEEAGPLERKREMVLKNIDKRAFLDVLMGGTKSISVDGPVKTENQNDMQMEKGDEEKTWNVLRDDFMMGAKLKDWDKNAEDDEADSSAPEEMDSDD
ncbi:RRP15-like protein [Neodiprion fabricii]|uniref:RRP15-like protein n=1 Tax=Neodiprion fabricii TaxID=2872261 RepID=UPI001ED93964|nr:RRP15-like protein [Neodiprion fabricii]